MRAFEGDTILAGEIVRLVVENHIRTVIETGTEYGGTAAAFAQMVPDVVTIDIERKFTSLPSNVRFIHGDSRVVLPYVMGVATPPILFYLDAHTQDFESTCPLEEELWLISHYSQKYPPPIIVIHDAQVLDHPELGYAAYKGVPIGLQMLGDILPAIYPHGYNYRFNSEATGAARGVLFIEPQPRDESKTSFTLPQSLRASQACAHTPPTALLDCR